MRHVTPEGAPLFTPGTELAEEFEELRRGMGEGEKVSFCFFVGMRGVFWGKGGVWGKREGGWGRGEGREGLLADLIGEM